MAAVWYTGSGDSRTITAAQWTAAGIGGSPATTTWDSSNGWSIPRTSFTAPQLAILDAQGEFNTNAADGPRPGSAVVTSASPTLRRSDLDALGIAPSQLLRKYKDSRILRDTTKTLGPISTDFTSVGLNVASDPLFNRPYQISNGTLQQVCDFGEGLEFAIAGYNYAYGPVNTMPHSYWMMTDAPEFAFTVYAGFAPLGQWGFKIYIDGRPTQLSPYVPTATASPSLHKLTMPNSNGRARLIEIRTNSFISLVSVKKPYNVWKPPPRSGLKMLTIGDSYTSTFGATNAMDAAYAEMGPEMGIERHWVDAVSGSGFGVHSSANGTDVPAGGPNRYIDRINGLTITPPNSPTPASRVWDIGQIGFDIVDLHGGGANDKFKGRTNQQVIDDATTAIRAIRQKLPDAKIVFTEGFIAPVAFPTFNPDYIAIRTALQASLVDVGVYYIDVATTYPWINGTGYNNTGDATENSYLYIGADGIHPDDEGHRYIRSRKAAKMRRIIADDGSLLNTLV